MEAAGGRRAVYDRGVVTARERAQSVSSGIDLYGGEADDFAAGVLDGKPLPVSFEWTVWAISGAWTNAQAGWIAVLICALRLSAAQPSPQLFDSAPAALFAVGAEDADEDALDFDVLVHIDGGHGTVGGLEADAAAFAVEAA